MIDNEFERLLEKARKEGMRPRKPVYRDEVDLASDESFPASDPPSYNSAARSRKKKVAAKPSRREAASQA